MKCDLRRRLIDTCSKHPQGGWTPDEHMKMIKNKFQIRILEVENLITVINTVIKKIGRLKSFNFLDVSFCYMPVVKLTIKKKKKKQIGLVIDNF